MADNTTETVTTVTTEAATVETDATDLSAEVEKWKALARKNEDRAKANAAAQKELDALKQSSMTDMEKAIETARAEARAEALRENGSKLVAAEVKVAAAGRQVDVDALLEGIDPGRFLDPDGQPDTGAISEWVDRVAPVAVDRQAPDLGQGARAVGGGTNHMPLGSDVLEQHLRQTLGIR